MVFSLYWSVMRMWMNLLGAKLATFSTKRDFAPVCITLEGEITRGELPGWRSSLGGHDVRHVIGVRRGKSLDAAKAMASGWGKPVFNVGGGTIASNDSPTSAVIAM